MTPPLNLGCGWVIMSNIYVDMITYPCPNADDGLANFLLVKKAIVPVRKN